MDAWEDIARRKTPDAMFDLVVVGAYIAGQYGRDIPVDEARVVFTAIERVIIARAKRAASSTSAS